MKKVYLQKEEQLEGEGENEALKRRVEAVQGLLLFFLHKRMRMNINLNYVIIYLSIYEIYYAELVRYVLYSKKITKDCEISRSNVICCRFSAFFDDFGKTSKNEGQMLGRVLISNRITLK